MYVPRVCNTSFSMCGTTQEVYRNGVSVYICTCVMVIDDIVCVVVEYRASEGATPVITTCKRSLWQGNVFIPFCQSFCSLGGSLYDVTSCLAAWSHVPSRGSLSGVSMGKGPL